MATIVITIPDDLLELIDAQVRRRSTSRDDLLVTAVRREIARRDNDLVSDAVERSHARFLDSGGFEAADLVRTDRDSQR